MNKNHKPINIEEVKYINNQDPVIIDITKTAPNFFIKVDKMPESGGYSPRTRINFLLSKLALEIEYYVQEESNGNQILYYHKPSDVSEKNWIYPISAECPSHLYSKAFEEIVERIILSSFYYKSLTDGNTFSEIFHFSKIKRVYRPARRIKSNKLSVLLPKNTFDSRINFDSYNHIYQLTRNVEREKWIEVIKNS